MEKKTFQECCDEIAYNLYDMPFDNMVTLSCIKEVMQEAAELFNQETAAERDSLILDSNNK